MLNFIRGVKWNGIFIISIILIILIILYSIINSFYVKQINNIHNNPEICIIMNAYMGDMLYEQLNNFNEYIKIPYIVIINCSNDLYDKLKNKKIKNVILNPEHFDKKRFHGSILKGIISNINYLLSLHLDVSCILILSNRCFFKKKFYNEKIEYNPNTLRMKNEIDIKNWHWPIFRETILFKRYDKLSLSEHEGLLLNITEVKYINDFMNDNPNIKEELFNKDGCVEEFAIQTILINGDHNFRQLYQFDPPENLNEKIQDIYIYKKY